MTTTSPKMATSPPTKDWSASQYLKFNTLRTRPVHDLLSQVLPHITSSTPRIYDLGCGPANSTEVVAAALPGAKITGMDSSPDMLAKARTTLPSVEFVLGDLSTFEPSQPPDLLFSNAVFHWLRSTERIPTLVRLFKTVQPGGVIAIQLPDNYDEPSHAAMRDTARMQGTEWSKYFERAEPGNKMHKQRPDLDPVESAGAWYDALITHASNVNVWRTQYSHVLKDAAAIVEWVKGTGLQPFLNTMGDDGEARAAFLKEYERRLERVYQRTKDGNVLLVYPRLFVVAVRK
jgi:trans-aconitate 2-methyltransferase